MNERENNRKIMQDGLDALKTQKERNMMGQYSTPYPLALDMMQYMRTLIGNDSASFIEPAIGTGVFYLRKSQQLQPERKLCGLCNRRMGYDYEMLRKKP